MIAPSDQGSIHSEDWSSENSSGLLGKFWRRESTFIDKQRKNKKALNKCDESERKTTLSKLPPLIAKLKPSSKFESRSESDVLYEGLKRAQRCRLEDQRGTEINFELPDFLKDKENAPQSGKKIKKVDEAQENKYFSCEDVKPGCDILYLEEKPGVNQIVNQNPKLSDPPPPLPPKPKNLQLWTYSADQKPRTRTRRAVYLDQPSSSFV